VLRDRIDAELIKVDIHSTFSTTLRLPRDQSARLRPILVLDKASSCRRARDRAVPGGPKRLPARARRRHDGALPLQEWLAFVNTELHKTFARCSMQAPRRVKAATVASSETDRLGRTATRCEAVHARRAVQRRDAYLFTILNWVPRLGIELNEWRAGGVSRSGLRRGRQCVRRCGFEA